MVRTSPCLRRKSLSTTCRSASRQPIPSTTSRKTPSTDPKRQAVNPADNRCIQLVVCLLRPDKLVTLLLFYCLLSRNRRHQGHQHNILTPGNHHAEIGRASCRERV